MARPPRPPRRNAGRPTDDARAERLADSEALMLRGWTRDGALALARKHGVGERAVRRWRVEVGDALRTAAESRSDPDADLADTLTRLELVFTAALAAGRLNVARACVMDRARLLGLLTNQLDVRADLAPILSPEELAERRRQEVKHLATTPQGAEVLAALGWTAQASE